MSITRGGPSSSVACAIKSEMDAVPKGLIRRAGSIGPRKPVLCNGRRRVIWLGSTSSVGAGEREREVRGEGYVCEVTRGCCGEWQAHVEGYACPAMVYG